MSTTPAGPVLTSALSIAGAQFVRWGFGRPFWLPAPSSRVVPLQVLECIDCLVNLLPFSAKFGDYFWQVHKRGKHPANLGKSAPRAPRHFYFLHVALQFKAGSFPTANAT